MPVTLHPGGFAPRQSTPTSCGAACLVVARALIDPGYAAWLAGNDLGDSGGDKPFADTSQNPAGEEQRRWAAAQSQVMRRTNSVLRRPGLMTTPWPNALGTPPWGARVELERHCSAPGTSYGVRRVRFSGAADAGKVFDGTIARVGVGRPVLLYAGNAWLPRHIVLWAKSAPRTPVVQYDPHTGAVTHPSRDRFTSAGLDLSGWDVPWLVVRPGPAATALDSGRVGVRLPKRNPGIA